MESLTSRSFLFKNRPMASIVIILLCVLRDAISPIDACFVVREMHNDYIQCLKEGCLCPFPTVTGRHIDKFDNALKLFAF